MSPMKESENVDKKFLGAVSQKVLIGISFAVLFIILIFLVIQESPFSLLKGFSTTKNPEQISTAENTEERELRHLITTVFSEVDDFWYLNFHNSNMEYRRAQLVIYEGSFTPACENQDTIAGPFYCPHDEKVYIDLAFHEDLHKKYDKPSHFALIYLIAHEAGHHIQKLRGTWDKVESLRSNVSEEKFKKYKLLLELQADFYAGVWAHFSHRLNLLDSKDIKEALFAATETSNENIKNYLPKGYVVLDPFTHGTPEERYNWFYKGFTSGNFKEGEIFK